MSSTSTTSRDPETTYQAYLHTVATLNEDHFNRCGQVSSYLSIASAIGSAASWIFSKPGLNAGANTVELAALAAAFGLLAKTFYGQGALEKQRAASIAKNFLPPKAQPAKPKTTPRPPEVVVAVSLNPKISTAINRLNNIRTALHFEPKQAKSVHLSEVAAAASPKSKTKHVSFDSIVEQRNLPESHKNKTKLNCDLAGIRNNSEELQMHIDFYGFSPEDFPKMPTGSGRLTTERANQLFNQLYAEAPNLKNRSKL